VNSIHAPDLRLEPYYSAKHYPLLVAWWKARGDECLPADVLPPTGAVVTRDGQPIAICIVWLTNARTAHVAFPIVMPRLRPKESYHAVTLAIQGAVDLAKVKGCRFIWASAENRAVDHILTETIGFTRTTPLNSYFLLTDPAISHDTLVGKDFSN
jgi:hypothetical protein